MHESQGSPLVTMQKLITSYRLPQLIYVAAELGIADLLRDGARHYEELAQASGAHPYSLYRVLRALASAGIFDQPESGRFELNTLGETLLRDRADSAHGLAMMTGQIFYPSWGNLLHSVKTGENGFEPIHGTGLWEYCEQNPIAGRIFDQALSELSRDTAAAAVEAFDFSRIHCIVDVGGGRGVLLATILKANPSAQGVLFDQAPVIQGAQERLYAAGVLPRCRLVPGDFFDRVPAGGDAYILSQILHDWNDSKAAQILGTCRRAMSENQTLFILERVIEADQPTVKSTLADIGMMVVFGGRERTQAEYESLLRGAGFQLTNVIRTRTPIYIVEARSI